MLLFLLTVQVVNKLHEEIIYIYRQDFNRRQILPSVNLTDERQQSLKKSI